MRTMLPSLLLAALIGVPRAAVAQDVPAHTVLEGVYGVDQTLRGRATFEKSCGWCHETSDFQGDSFRITWSGRSVHDFFRFMQDSLAHNEVARLNGAQYADIVAYVFRLNGFPTGGEELVTDADVLRGIVIADPVEVVDPATIVATGPPGGGGFERSTMDGVFTDAQAQLGTGVFERVCSACHETSDFQDADFRGAWVGGSLADLLSFIGENMPDDDPGALPAHEYAEALAYILQLNGVPAGSAELPTEAAALRAVRFDIP